MKRKRTRSEIIYEVALGGIASAMALLLVWLSVVVPYGTIALYDILFGIVPQKLKEYNYFLRVA